MSAVAARPPISPSASSSNTLKLNGHLPNGTGHAHGTSSLLKEMLESEMRFGEPVGKNNWDLGGGVREILPGPRSPETNGHALPTPPVSAQSLSNGRGDENEELEGSPASPLRSRNAGPSKPSATLIGPTLPAQMNGSTPTATPTRKGKEVANPPSIPSTPRAGASAASRPLHEDPIDLSWPAHLRTRKQSSAGLYNPSMACYANATLQVLLHTPPVLRIAQTHDVDNCESWRIEPVVCNATSLTRCRSAGADQEMVHAVRLEEARAG